jgi:hypothetical protein
MIKKLKNKTLRKFFILVNIIYIMGRKFNFKRDLGRPFLRGVVNPLVQTARPFVNQGLAALKDKGLALAKDYGTKLLQTAAESPIPMFKNGGTVKGKKGKGRLAVVHGGEYVLPVGVKPTASQKSAVAKRKARAKK